MKNCEILFHPIVAIKKFRVQSSEFPDASGLPLRSSNVLGSGFWILDSGFWIQNVKCEM